MGLLGAASDRVQYELTPVGEYTFTLWDLTLETGQWGDQIKWVWLLSPTSAPDQYITRGEGAYEKERELWQFTKIGLPKGSRAREWVEALLGHELKLGEEPDDTDLIKRRMTAYLIHKPKKTDPAVKQEAIAEGSARAFAPAKSQGPRGLSVTPTDDEVEAELKASDDLRKRVRKAVMNAELDETPGYEAWAALNLSNLSDDDLRRLNDEIRAAIRAHAA